MMFKRVFLFLLTNVMVIATISIVTNLLGLHKYLTANGIDYKTLAIFCLIWGSGGAFISLLISRWVAKKSMGVNVISPQTASGTEKQMLDLVYRLARKAGLTTMPEVGIYESPELNAFATGPSKKRSLVAISSGLLENMNPGEVEGVLGHEITHITNGDMITMTLIMGIVNAFALFLSRIVAYAASLAFSRDESTQPAEAPSMIYIVLTVVFDIVFSILGSIVVAAFSRRREYRADQGGARIAGRDLMISALQRLKSATEVEDTRAPSLAALKISQRSSWLYLFSTHPPLDDRIARLQKPVS
jgi:heat shock protein HtpX